MDVLAPGEGVDQHRVVSHMRQDTKFDLRVISREQDVTRAAGDEGAPDFLADLGSNWNVLQVRIGR